MRIDEVPGRGSLLLLHWDGSVLLWHGPPELARLAVLTAEEEVHILPSPEGDRVRCEPLREGDSLAVISSSLADSLHDLDSALEMALLDDPSPVASCAWLLDAADGDGATQDLYVGVLRHPPMADSA